MNAQDKLIVALDVPTLDQALERVRILSPTINRTAMGRIAGPLNPPVTLAKIGFLFSTSTAIPTKVLTKETASHPTPSTILAIQPRV